MSKKVEKMRVCEPTLARNHGYFEKRPYQSKVITSQAVKTGRDRITGRDHFPLVRLVWRVPCLCKKNDEYYYI